MFGILFNQNSLRNCQGSGGGQGGSGPPTPGVQCPYPRPIFPSLPPPPFFPYFFSGTPAPNSDFFAPAPHPYDPCRPAHFLSSLTRQKTLHTPGFYRSDFFGDSGQTRLGWVTHICISNLTIISSDNGLLPGWCQAIIWINAGLLLIRPLGTNFSEILIIIYTFSFKKIRFKMLSAKYFPFPLGLIVLTMKLIRALIQYKDVI